ESGGYAGDREKQQIRKLNYVSILSALYTIANGSYRDIAVEDYKKIPNNDRKLFDLKIEKVTYPLHGKDYILDLGIFRNEADLRGHEAFYYRASLGDQEDLSTFYGYQSFDATGYRIVAPKLVEVAQLKDPYGLLREGVGFVRTALPENRAFVEFPMNLVAADFKLRPLTLQPGSNPTFFLEKGGKLTHALINGFLLDLSKPLEGQTFGNALIYR